MAKQQMREGRVLGGHVHDFLTTRSPIRDRIVNFVRDNLRNGTRSVALCFRGNAATLYYRCHQLLRIRRSRGGTIGEFDFRHARFTENYLQTLGRLDKLHVDPAPFLNARKYLSFSLETCGEDELTEILETYRGLIDDFFDPEKTEYAFDAPAVSHKKQVYLEKDRQQQLWAGYFLNDALTYYDLEYSERFAEKNGLHGRFDLLGLRAAPNGYTLLLTELKSSPQAVGGRSGIASHERDYLKYLDSPFLAARKNEACEAIKLLCEIFQRPYPKDLAPETITEAKIQFVFSDTVIDVGRAYRPSDPRIEKAYLENGKIF